MALRWKILIFVGLFVALTDQWTKFLAVRHLTPGVARAHLGEAAYAMSRDEQEKAIEPLGFLDELAYFYGNVKGPCSPPRIRQCPTVNVVDGFWNWRYVENPGAAWGLLAGARDSVRIPFFLLVPLAAVAFIILFFRKLPDSQLLMIVSLSLVFGGAVGNFIDRLHLSYVIDFIDWYVGTSHWPTFNFADAAITTGVALMVIEWLRDWAGARNRADDAPETSAKRA